jgi:hypothetical protein
VVGGSRHEAEGALGAHEQVLDDLERLVEVWKREGRQLRGAQREDIGEDKYCADTQEVADR